METSNQLPRREWGKTRIAGGRHAFRIGLLMREFVRRRAAPARVLDAGCGDGSLALALLRKGYSVTAVDAAPGGLARFELEVASGDLGRAACCVRASLTALPLADDSFDAAVSGEVLEHLEDDRDAVRELHRVLRPGGVCVISVPANPRLFNLEDQWAGHLRRYTRDGIGELFTANGFEMIDLHFWGWPVTYLYTRLLSPVWLRRQIKGGKSDPEVGSSAGGGYLMRAMYYAFSVDRLFMALPFGIGFIGVFRKK